MRYKNWDALARTAAEVAIFSPELANSSASMPHLAVGDFFAICSSVAYTHVLEIETR